MVRVRMLPDGSLVEITDQGEHPMPEPEPPRPMTEAEVHAAAMADPDNRPLTRADLQRMKRRSNPMQRGRT